VRLLAFLILFGLCGPAAADMVTFQDAERSISFRYDDKLWQKSESPPPELLISIERRLLGGESIAICYLKAKKTAYAASIEGHLDQAREHIVDVMMQKSRERDPDALPIESDLVITGSQPMIELQQRAKYTTGDAATGMTVLALYTARHGEEVMLQCGYPGRFSTRDGKEPYVETEIRAVMKTLSFGK